MKIDRPNWQELVNERVFESWPLALDRWFDKYVEPINKMLAEGIEVYNFEEIWHPVNDAYGDERPRNKALLINIQTIKKWKCPCGSEVMNADTEDCTTPLCGRCSYEISKAVLGE